MPSNTLGTLLTSLGGLPLIAGQKGSSDVLKSCPKASEKSMPLQKPKVHLLGVAPATRDFCSALWECTRNDSATFPKPSPSIAPLRNTKCPSTIGSLCDLPSASASAFPSSSHKGVSCSGEERKENTNAQVWIEFGDCLF